MKAKFHFLRELAVVLCLLSAIACGCGRKADTSEKAKPATGSKAANGSATTPLEWHRRTTIEIYKTAPGADPRWDEAAGKALEAYCQLTARVAAMDGVIQKEIGEQAHQAVKRGCEDGMILYLDARFHVAPSDVSDEERLNSYQRAADRLVQSKYPNYRKFLARLRVAETYKLLGTNYNLQLRQARLAAMGLLMPTLSDTNIPTRDLYEACRGYMENMRYNQSGYATTFPQFEPQLFRRSTNEPLFFLLKGEFHINHAWDARGTSLAPNVSDQNWKLFAERLGLAEQALERAWNLDPHLPEIANAMLRVELGQGQGRERLETWFTRALALDTNDYAACSTKLIYLQPKWFGSAEDLLAFGRQCARSTEWGGRIPLILVDSHEALANTMKREERPQYWKNPAVWPDLKSAYEKFFALNPGAVGWRHNYARHAYWTEQWATLQQQLKLFGPTNYNFFGDRAEFDKMVALASQHAPGTTPP